jgi:hypothetical protein
MNTQDRHEYDTFNPDQIISVPSDRNAEMPMGRLTSSCPPGKARLLDILRLMTGMLGMTFPTLWNLDDYFHGRSYQGKQPKAGCLSL